MSAKFWEEMKADTKCTDCPFEAVIPAGDLAYMDSGRPYCEDCGGCREMDNALDAADNPTPKDYFGGAR